MNTAVQLDTLPAPDESFELMVLSDEPSEEIHEKTKWLLKHYVKLTLIVKNYELVKNEAHDGFSLYDQVNAEGRGKREHGGEIHSDVTASTVVLKDKREAIYLFYCHITGLVRNAVNCIRDPHQAALANMLFIKGMAYCKAQEYMERGYTRELYPISATTFSEKRRKCITEIGNMLMLTDAFDYIVRKNSKAGHGNEYGFVLPNWTEPQ